MKAVELTGAIVTELKTVTALGARVYAVPSRLITPPSKKTPLALVVYKGSDVSYVKGATTNRFVHHFAVYIVHSIWKEEAVITDATDGLLVHLHSAIDKLKDKRFSSVDLGIVPELKSLLGTEDYLQWGWYGASIGFEIDYLEVEV
jgi:hypothetical protein